MFRRRGRPDGEEPEADADEQAGTAADAAGAAAAVADVVTSPLSERPDGPWDVSELDDATEGRVDLGALRLPLVDGMELRLEHDDEAGRFVSVTVTLGESAVQLAAFAAPRSEGIWSDVATEIAAGVTQQGGTASRRPGVFGDELSAQLPTTLPDGTSGVQPVRFVGVDGPRWLLRALVSGPAATDDAAAGPVMAYLKGVAVVRGGEAMAPRDLIDLRPPEIASTDPDGPEGGPSFDPFERGPEITEIH